MKALIIIHKNTFRYTIYLLLFLKSLTPTMVNGDTNINPMKFPSTVWWDASGKERNIEEFETLLKKHHEYLDRLRCIISVYYADSSSIERILKWTLSNKFYLQTLDTSSTNDQILKDLKTELWIGNAALFYNYLCEFYNCKFRNFKFDSLNLSHIGFHNSDLLGASFKYTNLVSTGFVKDTLRYAIFDSAADMRYVEIEFSDLSAASMIDCNLSPSHLYKSNFTQVNLTNSDLSGAIYEVTHHPPLNSLQMAKGLDRLDFQYDPNALLQLRKLFRDVGYRTEERKINCALNRHDSKWYETLLFDKTCAYGSDYWKPLYLLWEIFLYSILVYWILILIPVSIPRFQILVCNYPREEKETRKTIKNINSPFCLDRPYKKSLKKVMLGILFALGYSIFISSIGATRIGFRDLTISQWVRLIMPKDIEIISNGLARTLFGCQSVFSTYMVILSFLSYFSRIFEY